MRIALTGTPGTGKTTVSRLLPYRIVDINALIRDEGLDLGTDPERGCLIADVDALERRIDELIGEETAVLEGHFSHQFAPVAVVLRTSPRVLRERLEGRGYSDEKIRENLEAEALDVILVEALDWCDQVHEIDTTNASPQETADLIVEVVEGKAELPPGKIDWIGDMEFDPE